MDDTLLRNGTAELGETPERGQGLDHGHGLNIKLYYASGPKLKNLWWNYLESCKCARVQEQSDCLQTTVALWLPLPS